MARSAALIGLEQYADAVAPLQAYLKSHPNGTDAAVTRARLTIALTKAGKFDEAQAAYKEFVQRHPRDPQVLPTTLYLAEAAYALKQRVWSQTLFESLVQKGNPTEYVAKGRLGLAWVQLDADNPKESAATFARLLAAPSAFPPFSGPSSCFGRWPRGEDWCLSWTQSRSRWVCCRLGRVAAARGSSDNVGCVS